VLRIVKMGSPSVVLNVAICKDVIFLLGSTDLICVSMKLSVSLRVTRT
jgi:hypothetical protein